MISTLGVVAVLGFFPVAGPIDAIASATQLELQLAEIQKLLNENVELSKKNREDLTNLVDELISGADTAMISLQRSRNAHDQLIDQSNKKSRLSDDNYSKAVRESIEADSEAAMILEDRASKSQKTAEFAALDAHASIQAWQALNRISIQLQELTQAVRVANPNVQNLRLNELSKVFGNPQSLKGSEKR